MVVVHCVLNQNSRVSGLAQYHAVIDEVVDLLRKHDVGFLQMPCPELTFAGAQRPRRTREEYDAPDYRRHCRQIVASTVKQVGEFIQEGVRVLAALGIGNSPSCGVGDSVEETGILMEELLHELKKRRLDIPVHAINTSKITADMIWLEEVLRAA